MVLLVRVALGSGAGHFSHSVQFLQVGHAGQACWPVRTGKIPTYVGPSKPVLDWRSPLEIHKKGENIEACFRVCNYT